VHNIPQEGWFPIDEDQAEMNSRQHMLSQRQGSAQVIRR